MNLQAEKLEIMKLILETNNPRILQSIRILFNKSSDTDLWDKLTSEQKDIIEKGIKEIEKGDVVGYDEFLRKHRR